MRPEARSRMPLITGLVMVNIESRFVDMTSRHCSKLILWNMPSRVMPALLTRTSTGPSSLSTWAMPAAQASGSETSHL